MPRHILRSLSIHEISGVDNPAQADAKMLIMKRAVNKDSDEESDNSGTNGGDDETKAAGKPGGGQRRRKTDMPDDQKKAAEELAAANKKADDLEKSNKTLSTEVEVLKAVSEMDDATKAYYKALDAKDQPAFLKKSADERKAEVAKAQEADAVVYKSLDGTEFRKSDDPRMVNMAKQADENAKLLKAEREKNENAEIAKRAGDILKHYAGEDVVKTAILKAVEGIADEDVRKKAIESLKSNNAQMAKAFETHGVGKSKESGTAAGQLEELAKKYETDHKVPYAKAYDEVLKTAEGKKLYEQTLN